MKVSPIGPGKVGMVPACTSGGCDDLAHLGNHRLSRPPAHGHRHAGGFHPDEKRTIPLSVRIVGFLGIHDVCLSLPVVVGANGIERYLHPDLSALEAAQFRAAAETVRKMTAPLK